MKLDSFAKLIEVLTLQKQNLGAYFTQCNASAADVTEITNELNNLTAAASFTELVDGYKKAWFEIKQALYDGDINEAIPPFPSLPLPPVFAGPLSGALTRTRDRNRRFKAGPGYTDAIGDALGIGPFDPGTGIEPTAPTLNVEAAQSGYVFSVIVSNRANSDQWELLVRPVGSTGAWASMGSKTTKSSDFTYVPPVGSQPDEPAPVQLQVRVQLKKNDANFGDPSDIKLVTVNP